MLIIRNPWYIRLLIFLCHKRGQTITFFDH